MKNQWWQKDKKKSSIISTDAAQRASDKIQYLYDLKQKTLNKLRKKESFLNLIKGLYKKSAGNTWLSSETRKDVYFHYSI